MASGSTPEERLLRLIRRRRPASRSAPQGPSPRRAPAASRAVRRPRNWAAATCALLPWLNGVLALGLVAGTVWVVVAFLEPPEGIALVQPIDVSRSTQTAAAVVAPEPPDLSALRGRQLFGPAVASAAPGPAAPQVDPREVLARFALIGVVAGETPQAIIEDTEVQRTFFLNSGDRLAEGFVVQEIREGRVLLDYHGQQFELNL